VKAMALNGLGFIERRLYLFLEFFDDITVEFLQAELLFIAYGERNFYPFLNALHFSGEAQINI